ncbi:hypothetical protein HK096_003496 [Nowakowskiella sp. JEL0078]|nr:hypothetical protein HK096_003496 [Nowakowskiella sp. JEL0078]
MQTVHINLFGSASPLSFLLDSCDVDVGLLKHELSLRSGLSRADFRLIKGKSGRLLSDDCLLLSDICADQWAEYSVLLNIVGGKGGFGSMLRAQGGRMASKKTSNFDSCRDLSGRRLKTINEAKKLAELLESEPERKRLKREQLFKKIEKGLKEPERQIIRFDDLDYIKDHEEGVESIKAAVEKGKYL